MVRTQRTPRRPLTADQQDLAARYVPMARALARPWKLTFPAARDDFESAAYLALVEAAEAFDPGRNVKFSTFARMRVVGALRDVRRRLALARLRVERGTAPAVGALRPDSEEGGRPPLAPDPTPVGAEFEAAETIETWLGRLPRRHAEACRSIYLLGHTQAEAARRVGCSQARLSSLHREALALLHESWATRSGDATLPIA